MTQPTYPQSATRRLVEQAHGRPVEALLRGYNELGWTQGEIADHLGVSRISVVRWFSEYGIKAARSRR